MNRQETIDPIVSTTKLPWLGAGVLSRGGHTATVYLANVATGQPDARLDRPPTLRERLSRRYWCYEVDIAQHPTSLSLALPAAQEPYVFAVRVNLTWMVSDAVALARSGIRDIRPIIWGFLDQLLRGISRRHSIETAGLAEDDMSHCLEKKIGDIGHGLRLDLLSVNVGLDEAAEQHLTARVETKRAGELAVDGHRLHVLRHEHAVEQAVLQGNLERQQEEHKVLLEQARARQDQALAAMAADHELKLKAQRVQFYETAIAGGGHHIVMLHLIEHPNDIKTVVDMLHAGRKEDYARAREILQDLLNNHLITAADAEPMREYVIGRLQSAFDITSLPTKVIAEHEMKKTVTETETQRIIKE